MKTLEKSVVSVLLRNHVITSMQPVSMAGSGAAKEYNAKPVLCMPQSQKDSMISFQKLDFFAFRISRVKNGDISLI